MGGKTYASGSLLATKLDDFLAGKRDFEVLFTPTATTSLASATWTKSHLVLNVLDDVKNRLSVLTRAPMAGRPAASSAPRPSARWAWLQWTAMTATRCG